MRTLFVILAAIIILGGGWYWYSMQTPADINVDITPTGQDTTPTPNATTSSSTPTTGTVKEIKVTNVGMTFNPSTMTIKKGDRVKVTYTNAGGTHDLRIDGYNVGTKVISSGSDSFEFVADKAGSFEYFCSVGNHRAMGMKGTLTVTE